MNENLANFLSSRADGIKEEADLLNHEVFKYASNGGAVSVETLKFISHVSIELMETEIRTIKRFLEEEGLY